MNDTKSERGTKPMYQRGDLVQIVEYPWSQHANDLVLIVEPHWLGTKWTYDFLIPQSSGSVTENLIGRRVSSGHDVDKLRLDESQPTPMPESREEFERSRRSREEAPMLISPDHSNTFYADKMVRERWGGDLNRIPIGKVAEFMASFAEWYHAQVTEQAARSAPKETRDKCHKCLQTQEQWRQRRASCSYIWHYEHRNDSAPESDQWREGMEEAAKLVRDEIKWHKEHVGFDGGPVEVLQEVAAAIRAHLRKE